VGLQKRDTFSELIVGSAGLTDRTQPTCVAGSGASCSANHYDLNYIPKDRTEIPKDKIQSSKTKKAAARAEDIRREDEEKA
jgi:hypothetical protein